MALSNFFETQFLDAEQIDDKETKQYRNALSRASQLLGHPVELVDVVQPSFRQWFQLALIGLGFSKKRAKAYYTSLMHVAKAVRESKRLSPKPQPEPLYDATGFVDEAPGSVATATPVMPLRTTPLILDGDDVCSGIWHLIPSSCN